MAPRIDHTLIALVELALSTLHIGFKLLTVAVLLTNLPKATIV
jgi:hypothetical protein